MTLKPHALTLILRRYGATGRDDLAEAFGLALARVLESRLYLGRPEACSLSWRAEWLKLLIEACRMSDDDRVRSATAELVASLRQSWSESGLAWSESDLAGRGPGSHVEPLALSIDACLLAADIVGPGEIVPPAIDELERLIAAAYRPGEGIRSMIGRDAVDVNGESHGLEHGTGVERQRAPFACLGDQVSSASALLTAYWYTERLPYGMLAEELMQVARRTLWDEEVGAFAKADDRSFAPSCEAARVLCRLVALREDEDYRTRAVLAPGADHRRQAVRMLEVLEGCYRDQDIENGARYALALDECFGAP